MPKPKFKFKIGERVRCKRTETHQGPNPFRIEARSRHPRMDSKLGPSWYYYGKPSHVTLTRVEQFCGCREEWLVRVRLRRKKK